MKKILLGVCALLVLGCGVYAFKLFHRKSDVKAATQKATELMENANKCFEQGDTLQAEIYMDSVEVILNSVK